eukprot:2900024-Amphidinium_carterae.2
MAIKGSSGVRLSLFILIKQDVKAAGWKVQLRSQTDAVSRKSHPSIVRETLKVAYSVELTSRNHQHASFPYIGNTSAIRLDQTKQQLFADL